MRKKLGQSPTTPLLLKRKPSRGNMLRSSTSLGRSLVLKSVVAILNEEVSSATVSNARYKLYGRKSWNDFNSPMSIANFNRTTDKHNLDGEFEVQIQTASKLFPKCPIRSHNEAYYQLKKAFGFQASAVHKFDISSVQHMDSKMMLGIDV